MPVTLGKLTFVLMLLMWLSGCASRGTDISQLPPSGSQEGLSMERVLILAHAQQAIGTPYRFGGNTPDGLDCSGLVELAYRAAGMRVPRTADEQFRALPALRPAHCVMIVTFVFVTSGKASIGVCLNETAPAITAITVQKNIKNLFFSEKATILSMNLCILFSDF